MIDTSNMRLDLIESEPPTSSNEDPMVQVGLPQSQLSGVDGIDVSQIQRVVDYEAVAKDNAYAWIEAGVGPMHSHSESTPDPVAKTHYEGFKRANMLAGFYFFGKPGDARGPEAQAKEFFDFCCAARGSSAKPATMNADGTEKAPAVAAVGWAFGELPPMLDLEVYDGLSVTVVEAWMRRFLTQADALFGTQCGVYSYTSFFVLLAPIAARNEAFWADRLVCAAQYDGVAHRHFPFAAPTFQQYDGNEGRVNGVLDANKKPVACDRDRFVGTLEELRELCGEAQAGSPP